jgi:hypothetical protein
VSVLAAKLDTGMVKVHLTTTEHRIGKAYRIRVKNLADRATQPNVLSASTPVKYLLAKGVAVSSPSRGAYELALFAPGGRGYVDRDYTLQQAPECLEGAAMIRTANNDKTAADDAFLSFELRGSATVYVGFDKKIQTLPAWLSDWKATGEQVVDSRSNVFILYAKRSSGGRFLIGGNKGGMDDNMYLVFVAPRLANGLLLAKISRAAYTPAQIGVGDAYYIDRDYTIASLPDSAGELLWIKTANDDKLNREADFLRFTLTAKSEVVVAYDAKIASLPKWLVGWEQTEGQVVDSRGVRFDLHRRVFDLGEVTLGGNCGAADDNMYFLLLKPLEPVGQDNGLSDLPGYFTLSQNYPNPFNPKTTIRYIVHKSGRLKITVFNVLGQSVKVLVDREFLAGATETVVWDGTDLRGIPVSSGIYIYRIEQDRFAKTRRMLLLR